MVSDRPSSAALLTGHKIGQYRIAACLGLIADTHYGDRLDALPPAVHGIFEGVDLILHAGDVGRLELLDQLGRTAPVVAVPTSVGYGAALEGVTALLAMLSSCAAGITVVGIDNGYGAACAVARLLP